MRGAGLRLLTPRAVLAGGLLLRVGMLLYGLWQDAHMTVKYTDIDYCVFTDAARSVWAGGNPYERSTYRYTPVLAWLLTPNIWLHPTFGKWFFVACDCLVGALIVRIVEARGADKRRAAAYAALWLLNPQVANISTRGSAESVVCAAVVATLYAFQCRRVAWGSVLFGLAVHLKIYPLIYAVPLLCALGRAAREAPLQTAARGRMQATGRRLAALCNADRIAFAAISGGTFLALTAAMYGAYGREFLDETYLYHVTRRDHRHNYSLWFLPMYLTFASPRSAAMSLLTFLPQAATVTTLGLAFGKDIYFAAFAQTFAFVAYNKVCTAQYFMWYICLLPIIWPHNSLRLVPGGLLLVGAWLGSQALYLQQAYRLEFLGENAFFPLWAAGAAIFVANGWILHQIISHQQIAPCGGTAACHTQHTKRE